MIAFDVETTGRDLRHGARPFFVTVCDEERLASGEPPVHWEWDVDPLTRMPVVLPEDLDEIASVVSEADGIVMQNGKFDVAAIATVAPDVAKSWPWEKTEDTIIAGHLLKSTPPHDLTSMCEDYLGVSIKPVEDALHEAVREATKRARKVFSDWRVASRDMPDLPSNDGKVWMCDYWLPRAYAKAANFEPAHAYWWALSDYADTDSPSTLALWKVMRRLLNEQGLWKIYEGVRRRLPEVTYAMESRGVTYSDARRSELRAEFVADCARYGRLCTSIASSLGHELEMPKGASPNKSLRTFMFDVLKVPPIQNEKAKTDAPTLNKDALAEYLVTLPANSKSYLFVKSLVSKRSRDSSVSFMDSYAHFAVPTYWWESGRGTVRGDVVKLYPSLNPTGTSTLRWSCENPNEQNISKKEIQCGECDGEGETGNGVCRRCKGKGVEPRTVRYLFGPAPRREWWSLDAKNIELRIPAYASGQRELIDLFERPDDPPYYGSNHLLVFDVLHPELFKKHGKDCKKLFAATWYQWVKNGNFAVQYQAGDKTADRAYHVPGARQMVKSKFDKLEGLNQRCIAQANRCGYVTTMPDRDVDPDRGYPLWCRLGKYGKVKPTLPLAYFTSGTAMQWTVKAMVRCHDQLKAWRRNDGFDGFLTMQVHDECVFDFPHSPGMGNLPRIRQIAKLMERGGEDIGIPTPVNVEYNEHNWAEGVTVTI